MDSVAKIISSYMTGLSTSAGKIVCESGNQQWLLNSLHAELKTATNSGMPECYYKLAMYPEMYILKDVKYMQT